MKHHTESPFHRRYSVLPAVFLLITALTGTAWAQDQTNVARLSKEFAVDSYMSVIWVERKAPVDQDRLGDDESLADALSDYVTQAAWLAERSFSDQDGKHVIILIEVESADGDLGVATYVDQATIDRAFVQDDDGTWSSDDAVFFSGAILAVCDHEDLAEIRRYQTALERMIAEHRERLEEAEEEAAATTEEVATQIGIQYVAMELADEIEQLQPPAYTMVQDMVSSVMIMGRYWPRELERLFDLTQTGDVVWVDFGTDRSVGPATAYAAIGPALAYAHMQVGDALAEKTVCVLIENEVEGREFGGYIASIKPEVIQRALSWSGRTRTVDIGVLQMRAAIGEASHDQVNAFRAVRDDLLLHDEIDPSLPSLVERAVRGRIRGAWLTVATAGGNYVFSPRELVMAEVTVLPSYFGAVLSGGYRTVPYEIEAGDTYRSSGGSYETAAQAITIDSEEIVVRASFSAGNHYLRMDLLQLVLPVRIGLESSISDIDLEDALDNRVSRYRSGFSIAQGIAGRIGPLYLGFTFDWGRWIWSDAPPQVNLYAGLSLKTGFRYRMGVFE